MWSTVPSCCGIILCHLTLHLPLTLIDVRRMETFILFLSGVSSKVPITVTVADIVTITIDQRSSSHDEVVISLTYNNYACTQPSVPS